MKEQGRATYAVGQQFMTEKGGKYTLTAFSDEWHWEVRWFDRVSVPSMGQSFTSYCRNDTYLGGPSPSPEGVGRVMEADTHGEPVSCLECGTDRDIDAFFCAVCCKKLSVDRRTDLYLDWKRGARDFPRSPAPVPVCNQYAAGYSSFPCGLERGHGGRHVAFNAAGERTRSWDDPPVYKPAPVPASYTIPVRVDPSLRPGEWRLESPATKPLYGRAIGEMRNSLTGQPLSALQAVQGKRIEPAPASEPWRASVDDDHWIPDV